MALMEFLKANKLNTTTMLVMQASNTGTAAYLLDRNRGQKFSSVDYNSTTASVISIVFDSPTVLSHVLLQNHNLKSFRVYYDSVTANSLGIVTANSQTSTYLSFSSVTVSSVDIQMDTTIAGSVEKEIGELILTERRLQFEVNPSTNNYKPKTRRKKIRHEMPDGGVKLLQIADKFSAKIEFDYISDSFTSALTSVFDDGNPLTFVPFPTTTAWGGTKMGEAYEVLITSDLDFAYGTNDKTQGYNGSIMIEETPSA